MSEFNKRIMKTPNLNRLASTNLSNFPYNLEDRHGSMDKFRRESTKTQQKTSRNKGNNNNRSPLRGGLNNQNGSSSGGGAARDPSN